MMENVTIDRNTMIRVNVPGTTGFYRLRCEAFFTVTKGQFTKMMKALKADAETAADNAKTLFDFAHYMRETYHTDFFRICPDRIAAIGKIWNPDFVEDTREQKQINKTVMSFCAGKNDRRAVLCKPFESNGILYATNAYTAVRIDNRNNYTGDYYGDQGSDFPNNSSAPNMGRLFLDNKTVMDTFTPVTLPSVSVFETWTNKGKVFDKDGNINCIFQAENIGINAAYIYKCLLLTDSNILYVNPVKNQPCYIIGNGFTCIVLPVYDTYKDYLPAVCMYQRGDNGETVIDLTNPESVIIPSEKTRKTRKTRKQNNVIEKATENNISENTEAAEAKENNNTDVPAGKEIANDASDADIVLNASDASDAFQKEKTAYNAGIDLSRLNTLFLNAYEKLYQTRAYDYDAVKRFDEALTDHEKEILNAFVTFRNDYISSDRECTAFVYALDEIQKETAAGAAYADPEKPAETPEKLYKIAGVELEKNRIEEIINNNDYLVKSRTVYRIERTRRGYIAINVYQKKTGVPIIGGACRFTVMNRERLERMFSDFADKEFKPVPAADPEKLETLPEAMPEGMPETAPAVIPAKTAENRAECYGGISYKASGKTSVYQPKTGITEGIKKYTYSGNGKTGIPAGIEKPCNCTNYTVYTNITNYHNMPTLPTVPTLPAMYRNDNMHNPLGLHNPMVAGFPSALSALEKIPFCDGKNAFCDIPSGVPPGPPGMRVSSRWNHPSGIIQ